MTTPDTLPTSPPTALTAAPGASPPGARSPGVFVIGCPRSGTSVLSWCLAAHQNFWTSAESDYLLDLFGTEALWQAYKRAVRRQDVGWLQKNDVGYEEFASCLGRGVELLYESRSQGLRWVDSTPSYTLMAETLAKLFPAAKFLHIVRDGRAVVNSMIHSGFKTDWSRSFRLACHTWARYASRGRQFVKRHPDRCFEVRYEELVAGTDRAFGQIFDFLGDEVAHEAIDFFKTKRINSSYGNTTVADVRTPKDPAAAPIRPWEDWTRSHRARFSRIAGPTMSRLGYKDDQPSRTGPITQGWTRLEWQALALHLSLRRSLALGS